MNLRDEFDTIQNHPMSRLKRHFVFVCVLVHCLLVHPSTVYGASNVVDVPAVLSLPINKKDLDSTLAKYLGQTISSGYEIQQSISDIVIKDPFEIRLSGIKVLGNLRGRTQIDSRGVLAEAVLRNLKISIARVSIHTVIPSDVGGASVRIRLDAECTNTLIDWQNIEVPVFLRAAINAGALQPSLDIEGLTLSSPDLNQKPEVVTNCVGPTGIESVLKKEAWNALVTRWTDRDFLRDVESAIERAANELLRPGGKGLYLSSVSGAGMNLQLKASAYKTDYRGAHLMGLLRFELDRPAQEAPTMAPPESLIPDSEVKSLTFSVATKAAESLLQSYFAPSVWNHWAEGSEIAGFQDLMSSRFSQFVAFPALLDFSKDAPFAFSTSFTNRTVVSCTPRGRLQLKAQFGTWMVLRNTSEFGIKPLIHFLMPTVIELSKTESGRPNISIEQIALSSVFHYKYVEENRPNTSIAHETILERIKSTVDSEIETFVSMSNLVQAAQGLRMECDSRSQTLRLTTP